MFGGAVLGRGTYGCVVSPSPRCETTDPSVFHANEHLVTKFIHRADTVGMEATGYKRMTEIDPYHNFSLAAYRYYDDLDHFDPKFPCKVRAEDVDPADALPCGMTLTPGTKFDAFVYEKFNGESFRKFMTRPELYDLQKVMVIMRLLFALSVMEGRVCHYDLHGDNVMVSLFPNIPTGAAAGGGAAGGEDEDDLPVLKRSKGISAEYTLLERAFQSNEIDFNSTIEDLAAYLETAGIPRSAETERAASDFYDTLKGIYFRSTERRPWRDYVPVLTTPGIDNLRPVLIDYGLLDTVKNRTRMLLHDPSSTYFQYYPLEYYILRALLKDTARTRDFTAYARAYIAKLDYTRKMYNPVMVYGQRATTMAWKMMPGATNFEYQSELSMAMNPSVIERAFEQFEEIIVELYGSTRGDDFVRDLAEFIAVKQDLTAIMMYLTNWRYNARAPANESTLCEEIVRAARLCTGRRPFQRPLAHQVYNHLVPFCKAAGLPFAPVPVTIKSKPYESFEVIHTLMDMDKAVFAESIPKIEYSKNKLLMRNIGDVEMFAIDFRDHRFKEY